MNNVVLKIEVDTSELDAATKKAVVLCELLGKVQKQINGLYTPEVQSINILKVGEVDKITVNYKEKPVSMSCHVVGVVDSEKLKEMIKNSHPFILKGLFAKSTSW